MHLMKDPESTEGVTRKGHSYMTGGKNVYKQDSASSQSCQIATSITTFAFTDDSAIINHVAVYPRMQTTFAFMYVQSQ